MRTCSTPPRLSPLSRRSRWLVPLVAGLTLAGACGSDDDADPSASPTSSAAEATSTATTVPVSSTAPGGTTTSTVITTATTTPPASTSPASTASSTAPAAADAVLVHQIGTPDGLGIVLVTPDGQQVRLDTDAPGTRHKHPVWLPDGSAVAFIAEGEWDDAGAVTRPTQVWLADPETATASPTELACDCWDLDNPAWSPDMSRVAFTAYQAPAGEGPPASSAIVVVDLATGTSTEVLTSEPGQLVDIPRWSPDGQMLVVSVDRFDDTGNETGSTIGVVPASGGALTALLPFETFAYRADWSPDGELLLFTVESQQYASPEPDVSPWDVFVIAPDGTGRRAVTDIGSSRLLHATWTPDASSIVATLDRIPNADGDKLVVLIDAETGEITELTGPIADHPSLRG